MKPILFTLITFLSVNAFSQINSFSSKTNYNLNSFLKKTTTLNENQTPLLNIDGITVYNLKDVPLFETDQISALDYFSLTEIPDLKQTWGNEAENGILFISLKSDEAEIKKPIEESKLLIFLDGKLITKEEFDKIDYKKTIEKIKILKNLRNQFNTLNGEKFDGIFILNSFKK